MNVGEGFTITKIEEDHIINAILHEIHAKRIDCNGSWFSEKKLNDTNIMRGKIPQGVYISPNSSKI